MGKYSLKNVKKKVKEKVDNWNDNDTGKTRIKWYDRWAKISGADQLPDGSYNWEQIDWENEFVRIEWYLCDPQILMKIGDPKYYAEGLSRIPEELHETLQKIGPGNDKRYCEIRTTNSAIVKELLKMPGATVKAKWESRKNRQ